MSSKNIEQLTNELQELNPTEEEIISICEVKYDEFLVNNVWRDKHNHHIHIGFHKDVYLGREEARHLIKEIKRRRGI
jgi:hypothetical protein